MWWFSRHGSTVYISSGEECEDVEVSGVETDVTEESTLCKKLRLILLEKLLSKQCEDQSATSGAAVVSRSENVKAEISHYKRMPVIGLTLRWRNLNKHILPNLAKLAQNYVLGYCGYIYSLSASI